MVWCFIFLLLRFIFILQLLFTPILDGKTLLYSVVSTFEVRIGIAFGSGGSQSLPATEWPNVSSCLVCFYYLEAFHVIMLILNLNFCRKSFLLTPWLRPWWKKLFTLPAGYLMNKAVGGSIYIRVISVSKLSRSCFKGVGGGSRRPQNGTTNFSVDCFDDKDLQTFVEVEVGDLIRRTDVRLGSTPQWNAPFNMVLHVGNLHFNLYEPHPNNIKCDYLASYENKVPK
ncbi:hypothetical protein HN51_065400 [Arachis hypogaea]